MSVSFIKRQTAVGSDVVDSTILPVYESGSIVNKISAYMVIAFMSRCIVVCIVGVV